MDMGLIHTEITLRNPRNPDLLPMTFKALGDTAAVSLCTPEHVAIQLKSDELEKSEVALADGTIKTVPYAGPIETTDLFFSPKHQRTGVVPEGQNNAEAVVTSERNL